MASITFQIITPEKLLKEGEASAITLPTPNGEIGILPNHTPLITLLSAGEVRIKNQGRETFLAIGGGFAEVLPGNKILLLLESAEEAENIDEARAKEAKEAALRLLKEAKEEFEISEAQVWLERNLARLKVAERKRKRHFPKEKL